MTGARSKPRKPPQVDQPMSQLLTDASLDQEMTSQVQSAAFYSIRSDLNSLLEFLVVVACFGLFYRRAYDQRNKQYPGSTPHTELLQNPCAYTESPRLFVLVVFARLVCSPLLG